MIGWLQGTVVDREQTGSVIEIIVAAGGVGYRVIVVGQAVGHLAIGETATLYVHHHFWEADQKLYGFGSKDERIAFEGLLAAHKVGPALALAILATYRPAQLATILSTDDIDALCAVPGVGKKTAQRLLVDLRSSLVLPVIENDASVDALPRAAAGPLDDVRDALESLGYSGEEVKQAIRALGDDDVSSLDAGELLKRALRALAGG